MSIGTIIFQTLMMPSLVISKTLEYFASAFHGPEAFAGIMGILLIWVGTDYFKKK